jgi:hypothetical protein
MATDVGTLKNAGSATAECTGTQSKKGSILCVIEGGSYWLGITFGALALLSRALDTIGKNFLDFETKGGGVGYHTFTNGMFFFLAISIATSLYAWSRSQKS